MLYFKKMQAGTCKDSEMPAREAYLVKRKKNSLAVSPLRADTVSSSSENSLFQINLLMRISSRPRGERLYPKQGSQEQLTGKCSDQEMNGVSSLHPKTAWEAECPIPTWPKRRNILGFERWVSRTGRRDLVSFGYEMLTCQWAVGALKVIPREAVTTALSHGAVMTASISVHTPSPSRPLFL